MFEKRIMDVPVDDYIIRAIPFEILRGEGGQMETYTSRIATLIPNLYL